MSTIGFKRTQEADGIRSLRVIRTIGLILEDFREKTNFSLVSSSGEFERDQVEENFRRIKIFFSGSCKFNRNIVKSRWNKIKEAYFERRRNFAEGFRKI